MDNNTHFVHNKIIEIGDAHMTTKHQTQSKRTPTPHSASCPAEELMREHARLYRAKALAERQKQDEDEENTLIGDWAPKYLWELMVRRINAIEEKAGTEQATSQLGVIYQLLVARSLYPVTSSPDRLWDNEPAEERKAKGLEDQVNRLIDSPISFLLANIKDPDLEIIIKYLGSPRPLSATEALQNLLQTVDGKSKPLRAAV